jgi:hypothetical protein
MSIICPCCKATNSVPGNCRRCKADLALLWALEDRRAWFLAQGHDALRCGDGRRAMTALQAAAELRDGDDLRPWQAVAALLQRDFGRAFALYQNRPHQANE